MSDKLFDAVLQKVLEQVDLDEAVAQAKVALDKYVKSEEFHESVLTGVQENSDFGYCLGERLADSIYDKVRKNKFLIDLNIKQVQPKAKGAKK